MSLELMESGGKLSTSVKITRPAPLLWILSSLVLWQLTAANYEGEILQIFKRSVDDPSQALHSWNDADQNACTWSHIQCNDQEQVTDIFLGHARLTGKLVPQLSNLMSLQQLELQDNYFTGTIPEQFGNLTQLTYVNLSGNNFSGPIPDSFGKLDQLNILALSRNNLSGTIPMSLTTLPALYNLDLSDNNLSGKIPTAGTFSTFSNTSFAGNPELCGRPLFNQPCAGNPPVSSPGQFFVISSAWTVQVWSLSQTITCMLMSLWLILVTL